jgi:hypothetical protein
MQTTTSTPYSTNDNSAWRTADKAWMQERKRQWKGVKQTLSKITGVLPQHHGIIKDYFLTGRVSMEMVDVKCGYSYVHPELPLYAVECAVLIEAWLAADTSDSHWAVIRERYKDPDYGKIEPGYKMLPYRYQLERSQSRLWEMTMDFPPTESLFNGLEKRLCRFLFPRNWLREEHPTLSEEALRRKFAYNYYMIFVAIRDIFDESIQNEFYFATVRLPEMADALPSALAEDGDKFESSFEVLIEHVQTALREPQSTHPVLVDTARAIQAELFAHPALPASLRARAAEV